MDRKSLLRLANYEYFISCYTNTGKHYRSPHEIIYNLEKAVCYSDTPDDQVLIEYKEWGDCIFTFDRFIHDGTDRYAVYNYDTTIS